MIAKIKYGIVWFLDIVVDDKILRHRFYWVCYFVSVTLEKWWGPDHWMRVEDDQKIDEK